MAKKKTTKKEEEMVITEPINIETEKNTEIIDDNKIEEETVINQENKQDIISNEIITHTENNKPYKANNMFGFVWNGQEYD